ncbi:hypothetical protein [Actinoplanes regularis]|nr:hypothetical protein [Actinoplanes regularis]GLW32295.1 hypothetical protein Areg01_52340 [Actinoplanes regularis]
MAQRWYEDGATTLSRNEAREARQKKAAEEDRRAAVAELRRSRRSI